MRTIDWLDGDVLIVDQTLLPHEERFVRLHTVDELVEAISTLAVRGAMALGVAGAMGIALAARRAREVGADQAAAIDRAAVAITASRPTAVNLAWGVEEALAVRAEGADALLVRALEVRDRDIVANLEIGRRGAELLNGATRILTHCNAGALAGTEWGTALSAILQLHAGHELAMVYTCETRPLFQGSRLTAWELGRASVPHRIIVDSASSGLITSGRVDAVVVGADRIAANGDTANKVGTLAHALAASRAGIPFVVAAPESTIDAGTAGGADIAIEERHQDEVLDWHGTRVAAPGSEAYNPAFDVTPADLITAIVTERRTIRPCLGERPEASEIVRKVRRRQLRSSRAAASDGTSRPLTMEVSQ
jgi:methylthioribose-1-phosphate isomerase